jgi:phosphonate transport system substrate-binding protein
MLARKDSGINTLEDMKGKKLGFADPDSTSGYLVPSVALPAQLGAPVEEYFAKPVSAAVTRTTFSKCSRAISTAP